MQNNKVVGYFIFLICLFLSYQVAKYWYSDLLYSEGKKAYEINNYIAARKLLEKASQLSSYQPLYLESLSQTDSALAVYYYEQSNNENAKIFAEQAITNIEKALTQSPSNINFLKTKAGVFIKLSELDSQLLDSAVDILNVAIIKSPTDAKLYYNLSLTYTRLGKYDLAENTLLKTIELKSNYKDARYALALIYSQTKQEDKAKEQLNYILEKIAPKDKKIIDTLNSI